MHPALWPVDSNVRQAAMNGNLPDLGPGCFAGRGGRAGCFIWISEMRRVVFGLLVGALVCALAIRLAMDVAKIAALDAEERPRVMRLRDR